MAYMLNLYVLTSHNENRKLSNPVFDCFFTQTPLANELILQPLWIINIDDNYENANLYFLISNGETATSAAVKINYVHGVEHG